MQILEKKLSELKPAPYNPRQISDDAMKGLEKSLSRFGVVQPVIWNKKTGYVVGGHQRLKAIAKMGHKTTKVIVVDLDDTDEKALNITLNNQHISGEFTEELRELIEGLEEELGQDELVDLQIDRLLEDLGEEEHTTNKGNTDPDDVPRDAPTVCKLGDLWQLGDHRLLCGDSTNKDDVARLMDGEDAQLWITDPPYNVNYEGKTKDALKIENDQMDNDSFRKFLVDAYSAADAVMAKGAVFYIWHADSEGFNFRGSAYDVGWKIRECLVWIKSVLVMGRQDYHWKHEPCLYGWKDGASHYWGSDRTQTTTLEFDKPSRNVEHPTMKPVELFQYQIENSSMKGWNVLDSFGGSGTTAIACENTERRARLVEFDPRYCDVIIKRWEDYTGQKAKKID